MRKVFCNKCGREIRESTAVALNLNSTEYHLKGDLCRKCVEELKKSMKYPLEQK